MQYGMQNSKVPMADAAIAKFKQYEQLLSTLKLKQQEIKLNPDLLKDASYSNGFNSLLQQMDAVEEEFAELQKSSVSFLSKISSLDDIKPLGTAFDPGNLEQMRDAMQEFADQAGASAAKLIEFNDAERSATFEINDGRGHIQQLTVAYDTATNSLGRYTSKTRESMSETKKFLNSLKHSFQNVARYIASFGSVYELFAIIKQGVSYVRDIDSALTELKKVTDETDASYAQFLQDMSKTGKVVGATVKDLTTMASEWARLGYSMQEAGQLAQSTAVLLNVSEFDDATKASEALISTMQAFQYTADESGHVVDILNEVGNNYAVSSDGIATALQDSASALMEGGNNLEQAVALVAAANRVVQDPNSVGSALRTISLRLRGTSVEILEEMGEETDNVIESTSKLQEKIKALSVVDILTDAGE
jgi:ABC-type transporter Mla subunit MlaD